MWLFALFLILPIIEIALFIQIGGVIGLWPTLGLVVLTALAGSMLMRAQGAKAMRDVQNSFRQLSDPTQPMAHGALILFAGALMLTPGFATDGMGLALLMPGVRSWLLRRMSRHVRVTQMGFGFGPGAGFPPSDRPDPRRPDARHQPGDIIEGDYSVADDEGDPPGPEIRPRDPNRPPSGWSRH